MRPREIYISCYINEMELSQLKPLKTDGAVVQHSAPGYWHLEIPAGPAGRYRLAQLDDYSQLPRERFNWRPPFHMVLKARASAPDLPGTWGFGLWNDPFNFSLGMGGGTRRFPALPNTAWFFFAAPPNYLSFRDDLPAQGFLAATFQSKSVPAPLLGIGALALPSILLPGLAGLLRRAIRRFVRQSAVLLDLDVTAWHAYELDWTDKVRLAVDGQPVLETTIAPNEPLGFVLWLDNQYAAFPPGRPLTYGFSSNPEPAWIEVEL